MVGQIMINITKKIKPLIQIQYLQQKSHLCPGPRQDISVGALNRGGGLFTYLEVP